MQIQQIQNKIFTSRAHRLMLDDDLAMLYEVETRALNQAVKRYSKRFLSNFMFQLTLSEWNGMSSHFVLNSPNTRPKKWLPYAFTEQGLAMLSGVLKFEKVENVNRRIIRAFVVLRQFALTYNSLALKLKEIETKCDKQFKHIYEALNFLLNKEKQQVSQKESTKIGFTK